MLWLNLVVVLTVSLVIVCSAQVDISYEITEESAVRTFGNLARDLSLSLSAGVSYRFLSEPEVSVSIASDSGDLSTTAVIDRDSLCPSQLLCSFSLDVAISNADTLQVKKKIEIVIQDLNDNPPSFSPSTYILSIPESAGLGRSFSGLPAAVDNDSPPYAIQGVEAYSLEDETDTFALQVDNQGGYIISLILLKPLDREISDTLSLAVIATDGDGMSGRLAVTVQVKDSNDHAPEFEQASYEKSVRENLPVGTTILTVRATDKDTGVNAQVMYFFRSSSLSEYGHIFGINNKTGDIYLKGTLDYEMSHVYVLTVVAEDQGSDAIPVDARVTFNVLDQNDCRPDIQINTLSMSDTDIAEIVEEQNAGSFVAQLLVSDQDSGENGRVTCNINDNVFQLEEVTAYSEYNIITSIKLDREDYDVYNLAIICTDQGTEALTSIQQLRVLVSDINDHIPEFDQESYSLEITENNAPGVSLLTVSATDADAGDNSDLTYQVSPEVSAQIAVNPDSGLIQARVSLDREAEPGGKLTFYVIVKDKGNPQLSSSAQVSITLTDTNDEPPYFDEAVYSFHVTEEVTQSVIGSVRAVDPDTFPNNIVSYSLVDSKNNLFSVGKSNGTIQVLAPLDRETTKEVTLVVTATDSGVPQQVSTAFVTIIVDDINDHSPVFVFPTETNNTVHISNTLKEGTSFAQILASDKDSGVNGEVTFSLVDGSHSSQFTVDKSTGRVSTTTDLSHISSKQFDLTVSIHDKGNPPLDNVGVLKVFVNKTLLGHQQGSEMLSKPNETAVIAVACVAAFVIIALAVGIACIYRHKHTLRSKKRMRFMKALTLLTSEHNNKQKSNSSEDRSEMQPGVAVIDSHAEHSTQRSSSVQDSGFDNSGLINHSWSSLNAFNIRGEQDNCSAEGSTADSGCVASEAEETVTHRELPASHIAMQFDRPGRKLLYTKTGGLPSKQECRHSHQISQSFSQQPPVHTVWRQSSHTATTSLHPASKPSHTSTHTHLTSHTGVSSDVNSHTGVSSDVKTLTGVTDLTNCSRTAPTRPYTAMSCHTHSNTDVSTHQHTEVSTHTDVPTHQHTGLSRHYPSNHPQTSVHMSGQCSTDVYV